MAWSRPTGNQATSAADSQAVAVTPGVVNRLIVVSSGVSNGSATVSSISDTAGNTWNALNPLTTNGSRYQSWYALSVGTGSTTITVTWTPNSGGFIWVSVDVFDGNDTTAAVKSATNEATGSAAPVTGSVTPADNDCLLWGGLQDSTTAVGSGFTKGCDDGAQDWTEFKALTGGSGAGQTVNFTGSGSWILLMAAFKPAGAATTPKYGTSRLLCGVGM